MSLNANLKQFMDKTGIRVRASSADTIVLDNVPVDDRLVNKSHTNLCVIREPVSQCYLAWVDPDLRARQPDSPIARLLTGQTQGQWQLVGHSLTFFSPEEAIRRTLTELNAVGLVGLFQSHSQLLEGEVLPQVATVITDLHPGQPLWNRDSVLDLAGKFFLGTANMVVFHGPSGSGLTSAALEVLRQCGQTACLSTQAALPAMVHVHCELMASDSLFPVSPDERLRHLLADCLANPAWFLLDNFQWLIRGGAMAQAALANACERGLRAIGTWQTDVYPLVDLLPNLRRRVHFLEMPPLENQDTLTILQRQGERIRTDHNIRLEPETFPTCLQFAQDTAGANPGAALALLHSALALVKDQPEARLGPDEIATAYEALRQKK